jgi:hypothetical protein
MGLSEFLRLPIARRWKRTTQTLGSQLLFIGRESFEDWCQKISSHLRAGESGFKNEEEECIDTYSLLPSFWHGMLPAEKKALKELVDSFDGKYTVECCKAIMEKLHIPMKDLQGVRLCLSAANEDPDHLERGAPEATYVPPVHDEIAAAQANVGDINTGLNTFLLKPPGMVGLELFHHMEYKMAISPTAKAEFKVMNQSPSQYLDVAMNSDNRTALAAAINPSVTAKRSMMADSVGENAKKKLARRKLNMLGDISCRSRIVNSDDQLEKMRNRALLSDSMAELTANAQSEKQKKKDKEREEMVRLAPVAKAKLDKHAGDPIGAKLVVKEINAILYHYYGIVSVDTKSLKSALVKKLQDKLAESI